MTAGRRTRRPSLWRALSALLCLTAVLILARTGTALALSGVSSPVSAVQAQYPDDTAHAHSQLGTLRAVQAVASDPGAIARDPHASAATRSNARKLVHAVKQTIHQALTGQFGNIRWTPWRAAFTDPARSGSLLLVLFTGIVIVVASIVRWRRGAS